MKTFLKFAFGRDDEYYGELSVEFRTRLVSGSGSYWIGRQALAKGAIQFAAYPLSRDKPAVLSLISSRQDELQSERLGVRAYPLDSRGTIGIRIHAVSDWMGGDEVPEHEISVQLQASYGDLARLSSGLTALAKGDLESFELELEPQ